MLRLTEAKDNADPDLVITLIGNKADKAPRLKVSLGSVSMPRRVKGRSATRRVRTWRDATVGRGSMSQAV